MRDTLRDPIRLANEMRGTTAPCAKPIRQSDETTTIATIGTPSE
jgi:hypothetical protein